EDEALPPGADALITLEPIRRILVRVQDPTGDPVSALQVNAMMDVNFEGPGTGLVGTNGATELVFGQMEPERGGRGGRRGNRGFRMGFLSEWTQDPDGIATMEIRNDSALYESTKVRVSAVLPGAEAISRVIDVAAEGTTEVTLQVPHTVALLVKLTTEDEQLFTGPASLQWNLAPENGNSANRRGGMNFMTNPLWGTQRVTDGIVKIAGFPPGAKVNFTALASQRTSAMKEVILATDLRQEVAVPVGDLVPRLTFALVDASGQPLANTEVRVRVDWEDEAADATTNSFGGMPGGMPRVLRARSMTTDAKGQIKLDGRTRTAGVLKVHTVSSFQSGGFRIGGNGPRNRGGRNSPGGFQEAPPLAESAVAALSGGEQRDLGALTIDENQILLTGSVVTHEGKPLPDAEVVVTPARKVDNAAPEVSRGFEFGGFTQSTTVRTDNGGRFVVFGEADPSSNYSTSARTRDAKSKSISFDPGFRGLVLTTQLTGGLRGRITKHTTEIETPISASLTPSDPNATNGRNDLRLRPDGSFVVRGLETGLYTLQVTVGGHLDTTIGGIEIRGGEISEPSALTNLVVGQSMVVARVHVTNALGQPAKGLRVEFQQTITTDSNQNTPGRRRRSSTVRTNELGEAATLLPANATVTVQIRDPMHLPVDVPNATFPLFIRLVESPKLVLTFPALPEIESVRRYIISLSSTEPSTQASPGSVSPGGRRGGRRSGNEVSLRPGATSATFTNVPEGKYAMEVYVEASGRVGQGAATLVLEGGVSGPIQFSGGRLGPIPLG
ncbi:MAG TPA: hypothetical protein PKA37_10390, partial [Planctomycetota bacterium]|nr:hypothetical protein [Planctomycetota bacterium]